MQERNLCSQGNLLQTEVDICRSKFSFPKERVKHVCCLLFVGNVITVLELSKCLFLGPEIKNNLLVNLKT